MQLDLIVRHQRFVKSLVSQKWYLHLDRLLLDYLLSVIIFLETLSVDKKVAIAIRQFFMDFFVWEANDIGISFVLARIEFKLEILVIKVSFLINIDLLVVIDTL